MARVRLRASIARRNAALEATSELGPPPSQSMHQRALEQLGSNYTAEQYISAVSAAEELGARADQAMARGLM
jgi:hypothetical protein